MEFPAIFNENRWSRSRDYSVERVWVFRMRLGVEGLQLRLTSHSPSGVVAGEVELPPHVTMGLEILSKAMVWLLELGCYYDDLRGVMGMELINDLVALSMPAIDALDVSQQDRR